MISGAARVAPEKAVFRPALPMSFLPGISEMHMATLTYKEQLLHPNWQRRRLEILSRDEFTCQACYDKESTLHVHHKRYVKGRMAWEYPDSELVTLCWPCHEQEHEQSEDFKQLIAQLPVDGPACAHNAMGVLAGWADCAQGLDLSRYRDMEPYCFAQGRVVALMVARAAVLFELTNALESRDYCTVAAAVDDFILDLQTRPDAPPPIHQPGHHPL